MDGILIIVGILLLGYAIVTAMEIMVEKDDGNDASKKEKF